MRSTLRLPLAALLITTCACSNGGSGHSSEPLIGNVVAITSTGEIVTWFEESPQSLCSRASVTGLAAAEHVLGIDYRTSDEAVTGWTSAGRLVELDPATGVATVLGWIDLGAAAGAISAVEFHPVTHELRVATNAAGNVRLQSTSGGFLAIDTPFAYAVGDPHEGVPPDLVALAHTNAFEPTERCTLFGIDGATNSLVEITESDAPDAGNAGVLHTRSALSVTPAGPVGFDITGFDHAVVSIPGAGGVVELHRLGFDGVLTLQGPIDPTAAVIDIAVRPETSPRILGVTSAGDLVEVRASAPALVVAQTAITGLQSGEHVAGLTVEPGTGRVLALGDSSRLYAIDPQTGVASALSASAFTPVLSGVRFGIAVDPLSHMLRLVSDAQQNLRIDLSSAETAMTANNWAYDASDVHAGELPHLVSCVFGSSNLFDAPLWGLDSATDTLVRLGSSQSFPTPDDGIVSTVGALGVDFDDESDVASLHLASLLAILRPAGTSASRVLHLDTSAAEIHVLGDVGSVLQSSVVKPATSSEVVGLTTSGDLARFYAGTPGDILSSVSVTGLDGSETLIAIDRRPANDALYGMSEVGRLYRIDASTGVAIPVGPASGAVALVGSVFGIDFDPRADELRVVSDTGQNLRVDPDTGALVGHDTSLAFDASDPASGTVPRLLCLAFANNGPGALCSAAFALDQASGGLVTLGSRDGCSISATDGTLFTVLSVGPLEPDARIGFDVGMSGRGIASYTPADQSFTLLIDIPLSGASPVVTGISGASARLIDIAIVR